MKVRAVTDDGAQADINNTPFKILWIFLSMMMV